jgi:hypothetical protein
VTEETKTPETIEECVNQWHKSGNYGQPGGIREFMTCPECSPTRLLQLARAARRAYDRINAKH